MRKVTLTCEKCNYSRDEMERPEPGKNEHREFFTLGLVYQKGEYISTGSYTTAKFSREAHWCDKCCYENKVVPQPGTGGVKEKDLPTLDQRLIEVFGEIIDNELARRGL